VAYSICAKVEDVQIQLYDDCNLLSIETCALTKRFVFKMKNRFNELIDELKLVVFSNQLLIDGIMPPLLFVLLSLWLRFETAVLGALAFALLLTIFRLMRRHSIKAALGGLVGVLIAVAFVRLLDREEHGVHLATLRLFYILEDE